MIEEFILSAGEIYELSRDVETLEGSWLSASYELLTGTLTVTTKSGEYVYPGFPLSTWVEWKFAPSKGTFYITRVKG